MSKTIQISNGDLDFNANTGILNTVEGQEKGGQDVARHLLLSYSPFFDEGNELIGLQISGSVLSLTDALSVQFITACINRLIIKQQLANDSQKIVQIQTLKTRLVGLTTLVFLVEVLYQDGTTSVVVNTINLRPTALNQVTAEGIYRI